MAQMGQGDAALFVLVLLLVLGGLVAYFFITYWKVDLKRGISPYTGMPLRRALELPYSTKDKVRRFLKGFGEYENRPFDFSSAALCRETGRLFPDCITWTGTIVINWSFIQNRHRGHFVSWGSLSSEQKKEVLKAHEPLDGFQTEFSSKLPSPRMVEEEYALEKPGPLYVDPESKILIGWKRVPETELEVLIVQKPIRYHIVSPKKEK